MLDSANGSFQEPTERPYLPLNYGSNYTRIIGSTIPDSWAQPTSADCSFKTVAASDCGRVIRPGPRSRSRSRTAQALAQAV